ncbi:hypothetical protein IT087_01450 [Candidatus Uhrbacteria bacterium]|nr:hypothetical protein [Candidatus Uhrbacteria bacterium]
MLFTVSGVSAVGKTSLFEMALAQIPHASLLRSYTTREPRENDLTGEYAYLSDQEWRDRKLRSEFSWEVPVRGKMYGTRRDDVRAALRSEHPVLAAIVPERVSAIHTLADSFGLARNVRSIYILSPDRRILISRLTHRRGLSAEEARKEVERFAGWDQSALHERRFPYAFITDRDSLSDKFTDLRTLILRPN